MALVDFSGLPLKVSRGVFIDTIAKFLDIPGRVMASQPPFTVNLEVPGQTSTQIKNKDGTGSIQFRDDVLLQKFLTKIQAESIMFEAKAIEFVCEDHNPPNSQSPKPPGPSSQHKAKQTSRATRHITVAPSHISTKASSAPVMNLHKTKYRRQPDRTRSRPNNARLEKKLQHRMSQLGQQARLKRVQFGVLRNVDFSVEYTKELLETAGYLSFEDDEKTLRVIVGGTHQVGDSLVPSIAIAIQTINRVALGNDGENDYMFLELLQHPRFERGDQFRSSTGDSKKDAKHSRTRLSQLDEEHGRIAPYASRWLKISFHEDGFVPDEDICLLAGLPLPYMDPELVFDDQRRAYSSDNIELLEDWLRAGSLPWEVAFQCEALFRNGALVPKEVLMLRSRVEQLAEKSPSQACDVLISFRMDLEGASAPQWLSKFEDEEIVSLFDHHLAESKKKAPLSQLRNGSSLSNFICHHVKITPTGVFLTGPLVEQSNRVIRRYPGFDSYFILVRFKDEGDHRSRLEFEVDTHSFSKEWIGKFLKKDGKWTPIIIRIGTDACAIGIVIGDRRYALLGYSQSGMRDHACLFSSRFVFGGSPITPASIRSSLGDFAKVIRCPARYGARMSQAFSSTDPSIIVPKPSIKPILDIKTEKGDFEFSDGCGTISRELAKKAWQGMLSQMPNTRRRRRHIDEPIPCAFQIRIGGSKGMVRMDPKLSGEQLCLRPSMTKFEAPGELTLEIARAFERPSPCFLNRPLIMLLWTNGVDSSVFEKMMTETLESTVSAMETFVGVARLLINNRLGRSYRLANTFAKLSQLKLELDQPGVRTVGLHRLMNTALYHIKVLLKHKARIPVPGSYTLVGVCDEDNYLKPREIYACVQYFDHKTGKMDRHYLRGRLLVTRSPYIHPGDAQILYGIGAPPSGSPFAGEDNHLPNCVVFSTRGPRPVPNMLGGGDLDGDLYNLIPLPELIPPHMYMPASYPPAKLKKISTDSTIDDVADFMVDFICHDSVASIAVNHLIIASMAEHRARDNNCIINAGLHSMAVDFMKTGIHVPPDEIRKPKYNKYLHPVTKMGLRPDWQAGHARGYSDAQYFECPSVLGQLFRAVQLPPGDPTQETVDALRTPVAIQKLLASHVAKYTVEIKDTFTTAAPWVQALLSRYASELSHICSSHTISSESSERVSEVEVMLGTNLETAYENSSLIERMKRLTEDLATFVRSELEGDEEGNPYDWLARAWRAYLLTSNLGEERFGALSFSWIALSSVFDALNKLDEHFLPDEGPIVSPFPSNATTSEVVHTDLDDFAPVDLENWVWDDGARDVQRPNRNRNNFRRRGRGSQGT